MMKILHLITSVDKGGAETQVVKLANLQLKSKNTVNIIYSKGNSYWAKKNNNRKLNFIKLSKNHIVLKNYLKIFHDLYNIRKSVKKFKPDIVHAHLPYMEICAYLLTFTIKKNFKLICTKHLDNNIFDNTKKKSHSFIKNFLTKIISNKYDKTIAISDAVRNYYLKNKLISDPKKIIKIYYGVNFKIPKKIEKKKKKYFSIGTISRLVYQKSLDDLINAYAIFRKKVKFKSRLTIVGSGPLKFKLMKLSKELKIEKYIDWVDFKENSLSFIKSLDVFVLYSKYEGLGLVLLEAMSVGTPIIASKSGAIPEVIKNNYNGILIKSGKPKLLANQFNKTMPRRFLFNNFKVLKKKFNEEKMFKKTMEVYNQKCVD